jgi:hypothetical protein
MPDVKNERCFNYDDIVFDKYEGSDVLSIKGKVIGTNYIVSSFVMSCKLNNNKITVSKLKIN